MNTKQHIHIAETRKSRLTSGVFSSTTDLWATPQEFFDELNNEFHFTLDPCALPENAKCKKFYTPLEDGLKQNWGGKLCSAIRHTARLLPVGSKSVMKNPRNQTLKLSCSFLQELIHTIFMITSTTKQNCVLLEDACISTNQSKEHHFLQWL